MKKIVNANTYDYKKHPGEKRRGPSATVSDMNYTMREILNRFTSGSPINDMGVYNEFDFEEKQDMTLQESLELAEEMLPHPNSMDLVDRQEVKEKILAQKIKEAKNLQDKNDNEKRKRQEAAALKHEQDIIKKYENSKKKSAGGWIKQIKSAVRHQ